MLKHCRTVNKYALRTQNIATRSFPSHLATHVQLCGDVDHGHPSTSEGLHATVQWAQAVVKVFDVSGQGLRVASTEILKYTTPKTGE